MKTAMAERIEAQRARWGRRLLILGHHYQRSEVLAHVDVRGDSLELARHAAGQQQAERIVFCGVRFMAETADILTRPEQQVFMPAVEAGCPMADMVDPLVLQEAWEHVNAPGDEAVPVAYVNSSAEVKAFCGQHGGAACTSGNAVRILKRLLAEQRRILFVPDEHLAANSMHDLGFPDEALCLYDPALPQGGLSPGEAAAARLVAWKGFCHVHTAFTSEQVRKARETFPQARIIVHPECPKDVVRAADAHGSTAQILRYVQEAPDGSVLVIGTELQLVLRLAEQHAARLKVYALRPSSCPNMARTRPEALAELLETWSPYQRIRVPETTAAAARTCLERMLAW